MSQTDELTEAMFNLNKLREYEGTEVSYYWNILIHTYEMLSDLETYVEDEEIRFNEEVLTDIKSLLEKLERKILQEDKDAKEIFEIKEIMVPKEILVRK